MKKISDFLVKYGINSFVLIILFILTIFISTTINSNQTKVLLDKPNSRQLISTNAPNQNNNEYKDFLIHYYETQADWVNKWLTALGILAALAGIGIPLLLNASYKEKIKEMQHEFGKNKELVFEQKEKLEATIKEIKKDYNEKIAQFQKEMKAAIEKAETESILAKLETFQEEAQFYNDKGQKREKIEKFKQIIKLGENSIKQYEHVEIFRHKVLNTLESTYFLLGLEYKVANNHKGAIRNFEQACKCNKILKRENTPALQEVLLKCYISNKQFSEGLAFAKTITELKKINMDGTHYLYKDNFFKILEEATDPKATELANFIEQIVV